MRPSMTWCCGSFVASYLFLDRTGGNSIGREWMSKRVLGSVQKENGAKAIWRCFGRER